MAANNVRSADVESAEKRTILQQLAQLEMKVHELERERAIRVFSKRNEFRTDGLALEECDLELNEHRKAEKRETMKHLSKLRHQVIKFKKVLKDIKSTTEYVETLKVEMELVESGLIGFKDKYKKLYDILAKDESSLSQEISAYERRFDLWDTTNDETIVEAPKASQNRTGWQAPTTLPAVNKFEEYVQKFGHSQEWDNCDHDAFLKALNKHQGQHQKFLRAALSDLPGYNAEEVENHYQWYMEYCSLLDSKRKAVYQWRLQQEAEKEERLQHAKQAKQELEQLKVKKEAAQQKKVAAERERSKQKLIEWKKELKHHKEEMAQQVLLQKAADMAKQKEKENERRMVIKQQLSHYASEKAQEMEREQRLQEERRKEEIRNRKLANEEAKKLADRDLQAVEGKLNLQKQKLMEENKRKIRLEKARKQPLVKSDPSRLYQLTSGWEQRLKQSKDHEETSYSLSALPKRAVPAWRQGV